MTHFDASAAENIGIDEGFTTAVTLGKIAFHISLLGLLESCVFGSHFVHINNYYVQHLSAMPSSRSRYSLQI